MGKKREFPKYDQFFAGVLNDFVDNLRWFVTENSFKKRRRNVILNGKQLDRHCSLLRFHKLNMWGTTCLCVKQDCGIRKAVHGWTILAVTVTLSHFEQLILCCCYRSIQESLNMACLYPFPCARSGSWISLPQRSPLSSFSFRASAVYFVCVWKSGSGGEGVMLVDGARQGWGKAVTNVILSL